MILEFMFSMSITFLILLIGFCIIGAFVFNDDWLTVATFILISLILIFILITLIFVKQ